jgi:ceramide synthetase
MQNVLHTTTLMYLTNVVCLCMALPTDFAAYVLCLVACLWPLRAGIHSALGKLFLTLDKGVDEVARDKFKEQGWQLFCHVTTASWGYGLLLEDTSTRAMSLSPTFGLPPLPDVSDFYGLQVALYLWAGFTHRFVDHRRTDFLVMFVHHVVTVSLLLASHGRFSTIGTWVALLHDASDVPIDLLKMANYLGWSGRQYRYATECLFGITLVVFAALRLAVFPSIMVEPVVSYGSTCAGDATCLALASMLVGLGLMNVYWFVLFGRLLVRLARGEQASAVAAAEYEAPVTSPEDANRK